LFYVLDSGHYGHCSLRLHGAMDLELSEGELLDLGSDEEVQEKKIREEEKARQEEDSETRRKIEQEAREKKERDAEEKTRMDEKVKQEEEDRTKDRTSGKMLRISGPRNSCFGLVKVFPSLGRNGKEKPHGLGVHLVQTVRKWHLLYFLSCSVANASSSIVWWMILSHLVRFVLCYRCYRQLACVRSWLYHQAM
jgi:hypothetical protein